MNEIPEDIMAKAWEVSEHCSIMSLISQRADIVAGALLAERERCAEIIEHRPLAIPDRQELAAYIRSGWHSLFAPAEP